ncbi:diguanylate cyclase [Thalassotalea sediminis]|uniref:diguanylate cyclase n=1 Tax=Thalassotalea sediminis TaxID=1759089 RepID=UPI002572306B|nr:diguanylate cyclase [Thalassotalea sediminis]
MADRLLVVEDSNAIAAVIKKIGIALGYEVTTASTLLEVEQILQGDTDFFAATLDFNLPDAPNGEVIETVLSHGIPSVVITGKMDDTTRSTILAQPVIDYIPKENSQAYMYLKRILYWQKANKGTGVLVVDDSRSARNYIVQLLKRRNFTVFVAETGQAALETLKQHSNIKLVITDLEMPVMDGIALTNELRKHYSREKLAIIGISGAKNPMLSARFIKNGADDFLRKPFCTEEFYCRMMQNIENLHNIEQIQTAANTDYLTGLPNRRAFFSEVKSRLQGFIEADFSYGLAMIDIDYFKQINDRYGHDAGDFILKNLASKMRKKLPEALLARIGGEEFAILLSGESQTAIYDTLDDFRREVAISTVDFDKQNINFSISLGVVFNCQLPLAEQMTLADKGLYASKENGRNQITVVDS